VQNDPAARKRRGHIFGSLPVWERYQGVTGLVPEGVVRDRNWTAGPGLEYRVCGGPFLWPILELTASKYRCHQHGEQAVKNDPLILRHSASQGAEAVDKSPSQKCKGKHIPDFPAFGAEHLNLTVKDYSE
jgi:hypothetical protein